MEEAFVLHRVETDLPRFALNVHYVQEPRSGSAPAVPCGADLRCETILIPPGLAGDDMHVVAREVIAACRYLSPEHQDVIESALHELLVLKSMGSDSMVGIGEEAACVQRSLAQLGPSNMVHGMGPRLAGLETAADSGQDQAQPRQAGVPAVPPSAEDDVERTRSAVQPTGEQLGSAPARPLREIGVRLLTGDLLGSISVTSGLSVADLKGRVQQQIGIPSCEQRLVWNAKPLGDHELLHDVVGAGGAHDRCEVHLIRVQVELARVALRCRPMSRREADRGCERICHPNCQTSVVALRGVAAHGAGEDMDIELDVVFDESSTTAQVYDAMVADLVKCAVVHGRGAAVLAYGQVGTGKRHTLMTALGGGEGVVPMAGRQLFTDISELPQKRFLITASFVDFYQNDMPVDLLSSERQRHRAVLKDHSSLGPFLQGVSTYVLRNDTEVSLLLDAGLAAHSIQCTNMERDSSQSSLVFMLNVWSAEPAEDGEIGLVSFSTLTFAKLSGSEVPPHAGKGEGRQKSRALEVVVSELAKHSRFVPYRNAPLTRLLRNALGGSEALAVVATCSPASSEIEETLRTLRFAGLARTVECRPEAATVPRHEFERFVLSAPLAAAAVVAEGCPPDGAPRELREAVENFLAPTSGGARAGSLPA